MSRHEENHAFRLPTEHAFRHRTEAFSALPSPRLEEVSLAQPASPQQDFPTFVRVHTQIPIVKATSSFHVGSEFTRRS